MSEETRERFAQVVREPDCDLAEAALLCCAEVEGAGTVDTQLSRLSMLAADLAASGFLLSDAQAAAEALTTYLAGDLGFTGDTSDYHDPRNGLLSEVLDRRRGLPITLAIVYIALARRLDVDAFGINTPGHFLVGVGGGAKEAAGTMKPPVVIDPFHRGQLLGVHDAQRRIRQITGGTRIDPGALRPAPPVVVIRRLLNNLTRDFLARSDGDNALWTVELRRLLPDTGAGDVSAHAEALLQLGRHHAAAETVERYLQHQTAGDDETRELSGVARRARAALN